MKFLHTMIRVTNIEESLDFFCNKLGLVEIRRKDVPEGKFTLIFLAATEDKKNANFALRNHLSLVLSNIWALGSKQYSSGNVPSSHGSDNDKLIHWCHGAPGAIHLFLFTERMITSIGSTQVGTLTTMSEAAGK